MSLEADYNTIEQNIADIFAEAVGVAYGLTGERQASASADADARRRPASNRSPVKRNSEIIGGFDGGIEIGWYGSYKDFRGLNCTLDRLKHSATASGSGVDFFRFGSMLCRMSDKGATVGRIKYKYQLEYHGIIFILHGNPSEQIEPIRVKLSAILLMRLPLKRILQIIYSFFSFIGFVPTSEIVSRADLQVTLPIPIDEVLTAVQNNQVVTECRGNLQLIYSLGTRQLETIWLKSRTTELCIYDKTAEIEKQNPDYIAYFVGRWGALPGRCTRFEYRFRREALKRWGINTVLELIHGAKSLLDHFSRSWFRILDGFSTAGNEIRQKTNSLWKRVREAFLTVFDDALSSPVVRCVVKKKIQDVGRLMKQAVGCLSSACAYLWENSARGFSDLLGILPEFQREFEESLQEKQKKYNFLI